jgi:hypothetical protein
VQPDIFRLGPAISLVEEEVVSGLSAHQDRADSFGLFLVQEGSLTAKFLLGFG